MTKEILVQYDKCMGCKSCEIACAVAHTESKSLLGAVMDEKKPQKRLFVHQVMDNNFPLNCRHCEDAPCIDACIAGAMHRLQNGTVTNIDGPHECTGCWMCVMVCPYGAVRSIPDERKAVKCDRECFDETETPACVRSCPTGAIIYTTVDRYGEKKRHDFLVKALS